MLSNEALVILVSLIIVGGIAAISVVDTTGVIQDSISNAEDDATSSLDTQIDILSTPGLEGSKSKPGLVLNVQNTGSETIPKDKVDLVVDGEITNISSKRVFQSDRWSPGEILILESSGFFQGDTFVTVRTPNAQDNTRLNLEQAQKFFDVSIKSAPDSVNPGQPINIQYEVINLGKSQDTQDITSTFNGKEQVRLTPTLDNNESVQDTISRVAKEEDGPQAEFVISSEDDSESVVVDINTSEFDIVSLTSQSEVFVGENITPSFQIRNTGSKSGTQDIEFTSNGNTQVFNNIQLDPGESFTPPSSLEFTTTSSDKPSVNVSVSTEDSDQSRTTDVIEPELGILNIDAPANQPSPVPSGTSFNTDVIVENPAGVSNQERVIIRRDGNVIFDQQVSVSAGSTKTITENISTTQSDAPEVIMSAEATESGDSQQQSVPIQGPQFETLITNTPSGEVPIGSEFTVEFQIDNTGGQGTKTIDVNSTGGVTQDLTVNGSPPGGQISLNAGEIVTGSFNVTGTTKSDLPNVDVSVQTPDDSDTETVNLKGSDYNVNIVDSSVPSDVNAGDSFSILVDVENVGGDGLPRDLDVLFDGDNSTTIQDVDVGAGQTKQQSVTIDTDATDIGQSRIIDVQAIDENGTVEDDDTDLVNVSGGNFSVNIQSIKDPVKTGSTFDVPVSIDNIGAGDDIQDIQLEVVDQNGSGSVIETKAKSDIQVNSSQSKNIQFTDVTAPSQEGDVEIRVSSENDTDTKSTSVVQSNFTVSITSKNPSTEVKAGSDVKFNFDVTNEISSSDTQVVSVTTNGSGTLSKTDFNINANAGQTISKSVNYTAVESDAPEIQVSVSPQSGTSDTDSIPVVLFDPFNGRDIVEEIESNGINGPRCSDPSNLCLTGSETIQKQTVNGFVYTEGSQPTITVQDDGIVEGAVVVNANKTGKVKLDNSSNPATIQGDVFIKAHGSSDFGIDFSSGGLVEGDLVIDQDPGGGSVGFSFDPSKTRIKGDLIVDANGGRDFDSSVKQSVDGNLVKNATIDLSRP